MAQEAKRKEERTRTTLSTRSVPAPIAAFPWERQPGESVQAHARFLTYRDLDPVHRSQQKVADHCGISVQLVQRWSRKWSWLKRVNAYDAWMLELGDAVGKRAALAHRGQLVRVGSALLSKAQASATKLDESKLTAGEITQLAKTGATLGELAFGPQEPKSIAPGVNIGVGVNFAQRPSWAEASETPINANKTKLLVQCDEQVIAGQDGAPARTVETKPVALLPSSQAETGTRLKERRVAAPVRKHDDD